MEGRTFWARSFFLQGLNYGEYTYSVEVSMSETFLSFSSHKRGSVKELLALNDRRRIRLLLFKSLTYFFFSSVDPGNALREVSPLVYMKMLPYPTMHAMFSYIHIFRTKAENMCLLGFCSHFHQQRSRSEVEMWPTRRSWIRFWGKRGKVLFAILSARCWLGDWVLFAQSSGRKGLAPLA